MAVKGYTSKSNIENYLGESLDADGVAQLDAWIEAIENFIDKYTGRNFKADSSASKRLFDGAGDQELIIDDAIEVTEVERGLDSYGGNFQEINALSSDTGGDVYIPLPANYSERGVPITAIKLISRRWPTGTQNNRITAKWGYSENVPKDIENVATIFVAGIYNQERQGGSEVKSEKIGDYQVTYTSDQGNNSFADYREAYRTLDSYKKLRI